MAIFLIPILLAVGLLIGLRLGRRRARAVVEIEPQWRDFLRRCGLGDAGRFLDVSAPHVGGHRGRSVARAVLSDGNTTVRVYLKREYHISAAARFASLAAGFGLASRSLREARMLRRLACEGVGCPECMAAGEDGRGRAFLLVRETPGMTELRAWLTRETDAGARLRLARSLGAALARMHAAGFTHPDLYSKHVLVAADGEGVQFLDWQRSRRLRVVNMRRRARDLAALHATLADDLARPRERLACLRAHVTGLPARRGFLRLILCNTRRLLGRRHVREKRQPPLAAGVQEWRTLDGGALCVTPALAAAWPGRPPQWLALHRQPPGPALTRRWLGADAGPPALLVRRCRRLAASDLWHRRSAEPEQRQAELLLRLQRHGVEAPRVLAMGRRVVRGGVESFVLTQPAAGAVRLTAWLTHRPAEATRRLVLAAAGALLRRLHEAACFLHGREPAAALGVCRVPGGRPGVLLIDPERVRALRRPRPGRPRRDLDAVEGALDDAGGGPSDRECFRAGYGRPAHGGRDGRLSPTHRAGPPNGRRPLAAWRL